MQKIKKIFLREFSFFISMPAVLWQIIFLWTPLLFILVLGFVTKDFRFTLEHLIAVLSYSHIKVIFRSIIIATINTLLCLLLGYPVAYFLVYKAKEFKNFMLFF